MGFRLEDSFDIAQNFFGFTVDPPQTFHLDFNDDGLIKEVGFYTVDRRQGNTGGVGGAFGYFYGVGKPLPFPECQPFKGSLRFRGLMMMADIAKKVQAYFK